MVAMRVRDCFFFSEASWHYAHQHRHSEQEDAAGCNVVVTIAELHMNNEKRDPGCLGYIGDETTQLGGAYNKKNMIRIPIQQPVFHGMESIRGFF